MVSTGASKVSSLMFSAARAAATLLAEHLDQEVRGAVHHPGRFGEAGGAVDVADEADGALDAAEIADDGLGHGEVVQGAQPSRLVALLDGEVRAELSPVNEIVLDLADGAREVEGLADEDAGNVVGHRVGDGGQLKAEIGQALFNIHWDIH
jgi:hypothetical protein